ncbi:hypothetical protein [Sphingobium cupriresistens]|uniref:Uncharacterized protein n=1 Tax=Sphingobium cupriresistens LL01 TaxID=1420583 RepID=A0A0J7Y4L2_9SPHN|nr:hypothetical protein [Sphingobium cupriresistens]KMS58866.1 hypothetical protein V473_10875 [Sphingobium cupriresistens LL01]
MALPPTRGSTLISRSSGAKGGQYLDITQPEIDLVNFEGLDLWVDGKSLVVGSATDMRDRCNGVPGTVDNGVTRAPSGGSKDNIGYVWSAAENQQRLAFPTYAVPATYTFIFALNPANVANGSSTIRALAYEMPATESLASWLEQTNLNEGLDLRWRHGSTGGFNVDQAVPHSTRSILTVHYDAEAGRMAAFLGKTMIGAALLENVKEAGVGIWFGGRPGNTNAAHKFVGMMEGVAMVRDLKMYSSDPASAANVRRNAFIDTFAAVYGILA